MDEKWKTREHFSTLSIHGGHTESEAKNAVVAPIYQTSTFEMKDDLAYHDIKYTRMNNTPTHEAFHKKIAALEGGEAALTFSSGMAAISSVTLAVLKPGDHVLAQSCLYGGTVGLLNGHLKTIGVEHTLIDGLEPGSWQASLQANTRAIYVESITNPNLQVIELEEIVRFAKKHGLITIIDNTFPSSYNFQPLKMGFDISVHSATKFLNGHADVIAGVAISSQKFVDQFKGVLVHMGGSLDPLACFLLDRGVKTLPLRMRQHNSNALQLARFLSAHANVTKTYYPGLETDENFKRASRWFLGGGGVVSFETGNAESVDRFLSKLKMIRVAPSLGGVETLAVIPAKSSHVGQTPEQFEKLGFSKNLIRISVGVEDIADIIAEIGGALELAKI